MFENEISGGVVAIGDIHGEAEYAQNLLDYLTKENHLKDKWVVFLGDYIDNGPDSAQVIDLMINFHDFHPKSTFICGNHDLNLIKGLNLIKNPHHEFYRNRIPTRNHATLESYHARDADDLNDKMPYSHKDFFRKLVWYVDHPDYLFVHCGTDPTEPLGYQLAQMDEQDMEIYKPKWLHNDRLAFENQPDTEKIVISGHTPLKKIYANKNRCIIDTGCGYGGVLSALVLPELKAFECG